MLDSSEVALVLSGGTVKAAKTIAYVSKNADGVVKYLGITDDLMRRQAEHLSSKGIGIEPLMRNLSRSDARAVEQVLIETHGLGKNKGTLINKINSIATSNHSNAQQLKKGLELLESIGYFK